MHAYLLQENFKIHYSPLKSLNKLFKIILKDKVNFIIGIKSIQIVSQTTVNNLRSMELTEITSCSLAGYCHSSIFTTNFRAKRVEFILL